MQMQKYYLIKPKVGLLEKLDRLDTLSKEILEDAGLWLSHEGGKTLWSREDFLARAKYIFMLNLRLEYRGMKGIESILPLGKISLDLFDQYWDIECLDLLGDVEELPTNVFDDSDLMLSGRPNVDEWIVQKMLRKNNQNFD